MEGERSSSPTNKGRVVQATTIIAELEQVPAKRVKAAKTSDEGNKEHHLPKLTEVLPKTTSFIGSYISHKSN